MSRGSRNSFSRVSARLAALFAAAAVWAACPPPAARAQEARPLEERIGDKQKELERIKEQIDQHRTQAKKLNSQEKAVLSKLSDLEKEIDLSRRFVKNLEQQEALITERVDSLRARIEVEDSSLTLRAAALSRRLRELYKRDPNYRWDIVLGSSDLNEAVRRYKFTRMIAENDAALLADVRDRKLSYERESAELIESLADMMVVRREREEEANNLDRKKRERTAMLAQIRGEKTKHDKAIDELEKAQGEVKDLIGRLEQHRLEMERRGIFAEGDFAKLKGKLIRPVDGKVVRGFGQIKHPKYGTVTFNNGIDIGAAAGSPIRSVAPGIVEFVDWIDGYGKCVIINHGGGYYTLYAHVANTFINQGKSVTHGEVIAEVGDTGSLNGYECHFEIRQSKQALNPLEWFAN